MGGHAREVKTYLRLATNWFWEGMRNDVKRYVQQCQICQQQKKLQQLPAELLQPLAIPDLVWEDISIDFVEGLPLSLGFNSILVVMDRMSKYAHFLGLKHPFNAFTVATLFLKEMVRLHGFPTSIVSDQDRSFLITFWRELFKLHCTALKKSTAYHSQTDVQTEIVNKSLETYLRCFVGSKPRTWAKWLPWAEFSYNSSPHCSTKVIPFRVLYGHDPTHLLRLDIRQTPVASLDKFL